MLTFDEVAAVIDACETMDIGLEWRFRRETGHVHAFINCNDLFHWGVADVEEVTAQDLPLLRQAFADLEAAIAPNPGGHGARVYIEELFCARKRATRPQGACYGDAHPEAVRLLNACGPERPVGLGNPIAAPGDDRTN